jgi:aryl-alcohol dehydrogenase-like predicted oxidoreductase
MLHQSLKRLKRDAIDIYMIHWPDSKVDIRRPLEVLIKAKSDGKIKSIGLCNTNPDDLAKAEDLTEILVLQSEMNLFNQEPFDRLGSSWKSKLSMGWGTFDKGILSGRVTKERTFSKEDARSWAPWWNKKEVLKKIERTEFLKKILDDYSISLPEFCLQYSLYYYGLTTCLIGFKTVRDVVHTTSNLQQNLMRERIEEVMNNFNILD